MSQAFAQLKRGSNHKRGNVDHDRRDINDDLENVENFGSHVAYFDEQSIEEQQFMVERCWLIVWTSL